MRWTCLAAMALILLSRPAPLGAQEPPTVYLKQATFTIPFNVAGDTVEVQLYVSNDRGATWHLYAQQKPDSKRFRFRASEDGEYWFASRSLDKAGKARPPAVDRPERRVFVDSRPPRLTVEAIVAPDGEVRAQWDIEDPNLSLQTFRIGYRTDVAATWQLVAPPPIDPAATQPIRNQVAWRPPTGSRAVQVHVEVADLAGNWAVIEKQASAAAAGPTMPASTVPDVPPTGIAASSGQPAGIGRGVSSSNSVASSNPAGSAPHGSATMSDIPASSSAIGRSTDLTGDDRPRMSSSRKFALEYDIESAGPGGVTDVELWMTRDRGVTWLRHSLDADKTSPMEVEVDADGSYGLRIVIVSASGLASTAPKSGDPADLWVGVDTAKPDVKFASISYGDGNHAGQLDIRWLADDARFGPRPITLSYAESEAGPWTTIAASLPNTGQYFWAADNYAPKKIVLRIEARDEAGNLGVETLREPISLQGLSPAARIKSVQPR